MAELDDMEARIARAVAAAVREQLVALVPAAPAGAARITWAQLPAFYFEANAERIASANSDAARAAHVIRILGALAVVDTGAHTLRHYRSERRTEFTKRKMLTTPKTRNNEIELMRRMARWGFRQKLIALDPFATLERVDIFEPVENVRRNVIEDDPRAALTLEQFLEKADPFERALVLVARSTGMRRGELAVMEMGWIDRTPDAQGRPLRIVEIPATATKGRRGHRKGRQTWIWVDALDALDAYRSTWPFPLRRRCPWAFANTIQHKDGRPGKHFGNHLHKDYLTERFRRLQERVGAAGPSGPAWLHDLRRSFITLARRRGEATSNIRQASGHLTDAAFTRYDIHSRADAIIVRDRVEAARARDLAALAELRKGPHRASESQPQSTAQEKINER